MSSLTQRILVAIVGIPIVLFSVYSGGVYFMLFCALVSALVLYEFYSAVKSAGAQPNMILGLGSTILIFASYLIYYLNSDKLSLALGILLLVFAFPLLTLTSELFSKKENAIKNISVSLAGLFIAVPSFLSLALIRDFSFFAEKIGLSPLGASNFGLYMIISIFAAIWSCDTFAYFFGMAFGKHKMMPKVSPKKSWEGAIAGFIFGSLAFAPIAHFYAGIDWINAIVLGCLVSIVGQIGDLAESHLKRDAKIKDSGKLLPGHGGFWDRFDSVIFAAPLVFIYLTLMFLSK